MTSRRRPLVPLAPLVCILALAVAGPAWLAGCARGSFPNPGGFGLGARATDPAVRAAADQAVGHAADQAVAQMADPDQLIAPLVGRIERIGSEPWDRATRGSQALTTDVANGATVSLIESDTGQTVSTAVSSTDGLFSLDFPASFAPAAGKPYFLEAAKGLAVGGRSNRAGAAVARVRTLVLFQVPWTSLTGSVIVISRATTALSIVAGHRDLSLADQVALLGKVSGLAFTPAGTAIASEDFDRVLALVSESLADDQDPVESVGFQAGGATPAARYSRRPMDLVILDTVSPARGIRGAEVTVKGQNFPASGSFAVNVTIADMPASTWSVDPTRSDLRVTLPANAWGGFLRISSGSNTWLGPFLPISGTVGSLAGRNSAGYVDGKGPGAMFTGPQGLAFGANGVLYVSDRGNHRIRRVTRTGDVSTVAGSGVLGFADGTGNAAQFYSPWGLAVDAAGVIFLADNTNHRIRKIGTDGTVSTLAGTGVQWFADGPGAAAQFNGPNGVAVAPNGDVFVVEDGHRIRKVTASGVVSTFAGDGTAALVDGVGAAARFSAPRGIVRAADGTLYVGDAANNAIRKVLPNGTVSTLAGNGTAGWADGTGSAARFNFPYGISLDAAGNLYVIDRNNQLLRKVTPTGIVTTVAGTVVAGAGVIGSADGPSSEARFNGPHGVAVGPDGNIYVGEKGNHRIRVVAP